MIFEFCVYGDIQSSNPRDYEVRNCNFRNYSQKLVVGAKCLRNYWTDLTKFLELLDALVQVINLTYFCGRPKDVAMLTSKFLAQKIHLTNTTFTLWNIATH